MFGFYRRGCHKEIMPDDATLLRRYAETGAEEAFAEIVRRHLDAVYSAALRRVGDDLHLAQDVTQQVFIALARKAAAVARRPVLASWLHTATRHEAANVVRTERRRKAREQAAQSTHELTVPAEPEMDWRLLAPILDEAIDALGETDRAVILLRFVERRAFAEIGSAMRVSEDAARMRVDRALEKLRTRLRHRGVSSSATALASALTSNVVVAAPAALGAAVTNPALAAGSLGAMASGWLPILMTSKLTLGVGGLALLLATGLALREIQARREAERAHAAQLTATTKLEESLQQMRQRESSAALALDAARNGLAQAEALRAVVVAASPDFQRGGIARTQAVQWDEVFVEAEGFLSGPQQVALKAAAISIWNRARLEQLARKP